jgi:hypothetical protein
VATTDQSDAWQSEEVQMNLREMVAWIEPKRHLIKFNELMAALLRALQPSPQAPMKRRPF